MKSTDQTMTRPMSNRSADEIIAHATMAQRAASDPRKSVWVGASAGSGKTKVLTDRILRLLLDGALPQRLMCVTFTRAGAAEMKIRLNRRLSDWAVMDGAELAKDLTALLGRDASEDEQREARRLFAKVADAPGGLMIETIHAFCQSLLRRFPVEAGISPHFALLDEVTQEEMLAQARDAVLLAAREERQRQLKAGGADSGIPTPLADAVDTLTGCLDEGAFGQALREVTSERGRFRELLQSFPKAPEERRRAVFALLGEDPTITPDAIMRDAVSDSQIISAAELKAIASTMEQVGTKSDAANAATLKAFAACDTVEKRLGFWPNWQGFMLTTTGTPRKTLVYKKAAQALGPLCDKLYAEQDRVLALLERLRSLNMAANTAALLTIGDSIISRYHDAKSSRAQMDYDDLILTTLALLSQPDIPPWVMYRLDGGLDHLLVDEAQDTNPDQWMVLEKLTIGFFDRLARHGLDEVPRTIFVVGDQKQSIFSFQRADPREFDRMKRWFAKQVQDASDASQAEGGQAMAFLDQAMDVSFRSVPLVLHAVDAVFTDPLNWHGVSDTLVQHEAARQGMAGHVEIWPLTPRHKTEADPIWALPEALAEMQASDAPPVTSSDSAQRLAEEMARHIHDMLKRGETLPATGQKIRAGDIMVLVRSRSDFVQHLVRALKRCNVPVAGEDRIKLARAIAVEDLMGLVHFVLQRDDDLTLAEILRSPFIDLSEDQLFELAARREKGQRLYPRLMHLADEGTPEQQQWAAPARDWLAALLDRADRTPPYEFFATALRLPCPGPHGQSGLSALLTRLGHDAADPIAEFLQLALDFQAEHAPSLELFARWFTRGATEIKREQESEADELRIMTVHGSKGLQAPIVLLPDTTRSGNSRQPSVMWPPTRHEFDALVDAGEMDPDDPLLDLPLFAGRSEYRGPAFVTRMDRWKARQDEEYRRLLYVALTRAEDRLYICGQSASKGEEAKANDGDWYKLCHDAMASLPGITREQRRYGDGWTGEALIWTSEQTQPAKPPKQEREADIPRATGETPAWLTAPPPEDPIPVRPLAPSRPSEDDPPHRSPAGGAEEAARFRRGLIIHRLLELLPEIAPDARVQAARDFLASPVHGLTQAVQQAWLDETLTVLDNPDFTPIFAPNGRSEVPVVGLVGTQTVSGQIDRLVEMDGDLWVIDYKTNRPPPTSVEDVPPIYHRQMALYRELLSPLYPNHKIRCALLWTDGPNLMELPV